MDKIYKLPTDEWLINKLIEQSTEGYKIIAELHKKEKVIIKLSIKSSDEYTFYKLLEKLKSIPNIPKIHGVISCYETNENIRQHLKPLIEKGLCNGEKSKDSSKIYFTIMEKIKKGVTLEQLSQDRVRLPRKQILSILVQGLYTIYHMYYIFGILHNDFSTGNIILETCDNSKILKYTFCSTPYRYFSFELGEPYFISYDYKVESNGVLLYLIDFDQASIYHNYYINTEKINKHPIESAFDFIESISNFGDSDIYEICKKHYETRGKHLISYSQQFFDKYNKNPSDFYSHYLIDRTRVTLRMWMKELFKLFDETKNKGYGQLC
jgi:hypothetical protein